MWLYLVLHLHVEFKPLTTKKQPCDSVIGTVGLLSLKRSNLCLYAYILWEEVIISMLSMRDDGHFWVMGWKNIVSCFFTSRFFRSSSRFSLSSFCCSSVRILSMRILV